MMGRTHLAGGMALGAGSAWGLGEFGMPIVEPMAMMEIAGISIPVLILAGVVLGWAALLPDIDEPNSIISNWPKHAQKPFRRRAYRKRENALVRGVSFLFVALFEGLNIITRGFSGFIRTLAGGHRAGTHSLLACLLLTLGLWWLGDFVAWPELWIWFLIGYASHLLFDMMTISGLPILVPFTKQRFHLFPRFMRIRTGGRVDSGLRIVCWGVALFFVALLFMPLLL